MLTAEENVQILPHKVIEAAQNIKKFIYKTPLLFSSFLSSPEDKTSVYLKLENEQITGSFKIRGAYNKILQELKSNPDIRDKGVYAASSGNHGLACLAATKCLGVPLKIYCSSVVDDGKKNVLLQDGADLIIYGNDCVEAEAKARSDAVANGATYLSPYNDLEVIAGQGTVGKEILEDLPNIDAVLIPVGGGGAIVGIAVYIKHLKPSVKVYGCQGTHSKVMYESVKAGKIIFEESLPSLSDATAGGIEENSITFPLCRDFVDGWILVEEDVIGRAMAFMVEKHHKIVEGAAGVAIGAYMANMDTFRGKTVAILSCGSTISLQNLQDVLSKYSSTTS